MPNVIKTKAKSNKRLCGDDHAGDDDDEGPNDNDDDGDGDGRRRRRRRPVFPLHCPYYLIRMVSAL